MKKTYKCCFYEKTDYFRNNQLTNQLCLMKKTIALLLLVFPVLCIAQINFEPGYFIENGVKTECIIRNIGWKNNPASFDYKLNESDEAKTKAIKEISEFTVGNNYKYKKFTVNIDRSASATEFLLTDRAPEWKQETLLLKLLIGGELSLYQYQESNVTRYFYSAEDANPEQLVYKKFMRQNEVVENNMFRQQLFNLMKDQGYTAEKFEKIDCVENDLAKVFSEYNNAKNGKVENLSEKRNKGYFNIKITPGITFTSYTAKNDNLKLDLNFPNKTSFRIGAEIEYVFPFNKNKWSLFLESYYHSYSSKVTNGESHAEIDFKYIGFPIGIRHYMYLNQTSKIFINASYIATVKLGDSNISYYNYNIYNGKKLGIDGPMGFTIGGGYSYKRLSAELRYFKTKHVQDYGYWKSDYNSIDLILGYRIF